MADWQEKLLEKLLDEKLVIIRNHKLIVTKKFEKQIEEELKEKTKGVVR